MLSLQIFLQLNPIDYLPKVGSVSSISIDVLSLVAQIAMVEDIFCRSDTLETYYKIPLMYNYTET